MKWHCESYFEIRLSESAAFYTKMFARWGRNNHLWVSRQVSQHQTIIFFSRMWKKQCKYCHFYSLCKLPGVMQAKFEFSSHHCSLSLAIHAQTFVHLEIILLILHLIFVEKQIFFPVQKKTVSQGELSIICLVDFVSHAWNDCLLHQSPFVICKGIGCFWSVSIHVPPSQIFYTCYSTHLNWCRRAGRPPVSLTCWTESQSHVLEEWVLDWICDDGWKWHGIF